MKKGTIKPLRNLLLVKLDEVEKQTKTGIYVNPGWERTQNSAVIVAVGEDVTQFKEGDHVMLNPYALLDCNHDEEVYQFCREEDILAHV